MLENFSPPLLALSQRFLGTLLLGNVAAGHHDHRPTPDHLRHRVRRHPDVRQGDKGGGAIEFRTKPFRDQYLLDESVRSASAIYRFSCRFVSGGKNALDIRRFRAKPCKKVVDLQAASPSSWKTRCMARFMVW